MGELMRRRFAMMAAAVQTYSGIPVGRDNCYYPNSGASAATFNYTATSNDYFLTPPIDTGSEDEKTYTFTPYPIWPGNKSYVMRLFNTAQGNPTAVTTQAISYSDASKTVTMAGRYVVFSVYKAAAANAYMYYTINGEKHYLFKGTNVTD